MNREKKKSTISSSMVSLLGAASASGAVQTVIGPVEAFVRTDGTTQNMVWDIDGDGITDHTIEANFSLISSTATFRILHNDRWLKKDGGHIEGIVGSLLVGPSNVMPTNYRFRVGGASFLITHNPTNETFTGRGPRPSGFHPTFEPQFFGFKFDRNGNTHYGAARMDFSISTDSKQATVTIHDWAWEDVPDRPIYANGQAVPEPATATGLLALAAGAAGLVRWRRDRKTAATK